MKHRLTRKALPVYVSRALAAHVQPGDVVQVVVAHDSDCAALRGGACTCSPDLTAQFDDGRLLDLPADGRCWDGVMPS